MCSPIAYSRKDITLRFPVLNALKSRSVNGESPKAPSRPSDSRNWTLKVTNYSKIVVHVHNILPVGIRSEVLQICLQIFFGIPQFILVSQRTVKRATANASISTISSMTFYQDRMGKSIGLNRNSKNTNPFSKISLAEKCNSTIQKTLVYPAYWV